MSSVNNAGFEINQIINKIDSLGSFKFKAFGYIVYDFYYYRSFTLNLSYG